MSGVSKVNIHPIKSDQEYRLALTRAEAIWGAPENSSEGVELDILIILIEAYERVNHPIYPPDPVSAIRFTMEQKNLRASDIGKLLGAPSRIYDILAGRRKLTLPMIRKLHSKLGIPLTSLIGVEESKPSVA
jgi:HTH-type transcriptional regulator / antitoxin HigA